MTRPLRSGFAIASIGVVLGLGLAYAQGPAPSSYMPVVISDDFATVMAKMKSAKPDIMKRQRDLLAARYDLANRAASGVMMSRGSKPVQEGVRVKLPAGVSWQQLAAMTPGRHPLPQPLPRGVLAAAARQSPRGRHGVPAVPDR